MTFFCQVLQHPLVVPLTELYLILHNTVSLTYVVCCHFYRYIYYYFRKKRCIMYYYHSLFERFIEAVNIDDFISVESLAILDSWTHVIK